MAHESSRGTCCYCAEPVRPIETAAFPVTGWEVERGGGGANQIVGRQRIADGRIAHAVCAKRAVEMERRGIAAGQRTLV